MLKKRIKYHLQITILQKLINEAIRKSTREAQFTATILQFQKESIDQLLGYKVKMHL